MLMYAAGLPFCSREGRSAPEEGRTGGSDADVRRRAMVSMEAESFSLTGNFFRRLIDGGGGRVIK